MGVLTAISAVARHFGPQWFRSIIIEAEHVPATITGLFFMWIIWATSAWFAWSTFENHALAAEQRANQLTQVVAAMQNTMSENTRALNCSRQDRIIAAKHRELDVIDRLLERSEDPAEKRELQLNRAALVRELDGIQENYKRKCLQ